MIRNIIKHITATAALISAASAAANASALPADSTARDWREHTQFNALDYRLQRPAPQRQFPDSTAGFGKHYFLSVDGAASWLGEPAGLVHPCSTGWRIDATGGNWFTPAHGLRLQLEAGQHEITDNTRTMFVGAAVDYMLNFTGLLRGNTDRSRFELIGTAGPELQLVHGNGVNRMVYGARVALQARVNVSPSTFFFVEPRMGLYRDNIDGIAGWKRIDWQGSVALGVGYRINPAHWLRYHSNDEPFLNRSFTDNMFIGLSGGIGAPVTRHTKHNLGSHIGPVGSVFIGKWFSRTSGMRLGVTGGHFNSLSHFNTNFLVGDLDYLFNPVNALMGYRQNPTFDTNIIIGLSAGTANVRHTTWTAGGSIGFQEVWNATPSVAFFIEPKLRIMKRNFNYAQAVSGRSYEPFATVSLGFIYKIGGTPEHVDVMTKHYADPDTYRNSHRWFVSLQGGCFTRHHNWVGNGVVVGTSVGRWLSPVMAWRLGGDLQYCTLYPRLAQWSIGADLMLSLTNLTMDYDPERLFNLSLVAGVEGGAAFYRTPSAGRFHAVAGVRGAVHAEFRLSDRVGLYAEPQLHLLRTEQYLATHPDYCPEVRATIGLSYKF